MPGITFFLLHPHIYLMFTSITTSNYRPLILVHKFRKLHCVNTVNLYYFTAQLPIRKVISEWNQRKFGKYGAAMEQLGKKPNPQPI